METPQKRVVATTVALVLVGMTVAAALIGFGGLQSESDPAVSSNFVATTASLSRDLLALEQAVAALERRIAAREADAAHIRSISEVRIVNPARPTQNRLVPNKVIEYRGRTSYILTFDLITQAVRPYWTNIFHIGDTNTIRSPGIWQYPSNRRAIHFRQSGENYPHGHWNWGCDPSDSVTPPPNHWYRVIVRANKHAYTVSYNGQLQCRSVFDVAPPAGQQHVWFSDPWYHASPVIVKNLYFKVY